MAVNTVLATNLLALNTNRNMKTASKSRTRHSNRLSSGRKLTSASEDAAGLTISEKMKSQIRGLDMAEKNSEDTISMMQVMEGAMTEITEIFQNSRELSVQAANDTNSVEDRMKIAKEMSETLKQIDFILEETKYSGQKLFDQGVNKNFQIGANVNQNLNMTVDYMTFEELMYGDNMELYKQVEKLFNETIKKAIDDLVAQDPKQVGNTCVINKVDTALVDYAEFLDPVREAIANMETFDKPDIEKYKEDMQRELENIITTAKNTAAAEYEKRAGGNGNEQLWLSNAQGTHSIIKQDTITPDPSRPRPKPDDIRTTNQHVLEAIKDPSKVVIIDTDLIQNDPNNFPNKIDALKKNYQEKFLNKDLYSFNILEDLDAFINGGREITPKRFSETYINHFDSTISYISDKKAEIGSTINRLEYTIGGLQTSSENLTTANSQIQDADMAGEIMDLTKANVVLNASTTILSQSNSSKEDVLQLLR